jgi:hypothetical protein
MTSGVPAHPHLRAPRLRCRTLGLAQPLYTIAAMTFTAMLIARGVEPGTAVALSLTVLTAGRSLTGPTPRPTRGADEHR